MNCYICGNEVVTQDALPVLLIPLISRSFPSLTVIHIDPTENFFPENGSILIDSVEGISMCRVYDSIDQFVTTRTASVHDYDLGFELQLLKKLHKLEAIWIIGVPQHAHIREVWTDVYAIIRQILSGEK